MSNVMPALEVRNVRKRFGQQAALNDLTFTVPPQSTTAFIGANGAGKTTTFSLIGSYFKPDAGEIRIDGMPLKSFRHNGGFVGLLPQDVLFFESRTVDRQLYLFARLCGLGASAAKIEVERVLSIVQLESRADDIAAGLSHGMKVRLGIAQALIGSPRLILLDEPTAGLDPRMISVFRNILETLKGHTTIVISSHDLAQLEQVCDYVCIIDKGKTVRQGPMQALLSKASRILFQLDRDVKSVDEIKNACAGIECQLKPGGVLIVEFDKEKSKVPEINAKVLSWLLQNGYGVLEVQSARSLEQTYLEETGQ